MNQLSELYHSKRYLIVIFLLTVTLTLAKYSQNVMTPLQGYWQVDSFFGYVPYKGSIVVSKGRNDDTSRLYIGGYEYTYRDSVWEINMVDWFDVFDIGNVKGDDTLRIYGTDNLYGNYNDVYEYTFRNGYWQQELIATICDSEQSVVYCMKIGQGRNDDTNRLYLGHWNSKIYELSYRSGGWVLDSILPDMASVVSIEIGDGRNDGVNRVYLDACANWLCELTYSVSGWQMYEFGWASGTYVDIALGNGRNDAVNRLYSWVANPGGFLMYEYTVTGGSQILGQGIGSWGAVCLGIGRNDNLYKVYGVTNGNVYEFEYQAGWYQYHIDSVSDDNEEITVGQGRNDGLNRIYVGCDNGNIYEYSWVEEPVCEKNVADIRYINIEIQPNPFSTQAKISFDISTAGIVNIFIYDICGRLVEKEIIHASRNGNYSLLWPKTNNEYPAGIYWCVFSCGNLKHICKMIKIN